MSDSDRIFSHVFNVVSFLIFFASIVAIVYFYDTDFATAFLMVFVLVMILGLGFILLPSLFVPLLALVVIPLTVTGYLLFGIGILIHKGFRALVPAKKPT